MNEDEFRLTYEFGQSFSALKDGTYEPTFYQEFVGRIRADVDVLDIGAHVASLRWELRRELEQQAESMHLSRRRPPPRCSSAMLP